MHERDGYHNGGGVRQKMEHIINYMDVQWSQKLELLYIESVRLVQYILTRSLFLRCDARRSQDSVTDIGPVSVNIACYYMWDTKENSASQSGVAVAVRHVVDRAHD